MRSAMRCRSALTAEQVEDIFSRMSIYEFNGNRIRTTVHAGQRWMVFADMCKALGYKNPNHESKKVSETEKSRLDIGLKNTLAVCISSAGLYSFTIFSGKPAAQAFYHWAMKNIFETKR